MATTINPAVSRVSSLRWAVHLGYFVLGAAVGAALAFLVVAVLAGAVETIGGAAAWAVLACLVIVFAIARDLGANAPVPYRDVQVPQVLRYVLRPAPLALTYGTHLGAGFLTRYTYSGHAAFMLALPLVGGDVLLIIGAILAFACGKGIVLVAFRGETHDRVTQIANHHATWATRGVQSMRFANASVSAVIIVSALQLGGVM